MKYTKLSLLAMLCSFIVQAKVLIITFSYSNPEFLEMQNKTFQRFIEDEYEFVVFSDAPTESGHQEINATCKKCGIRCIRIPQQIHEPPYYLPLNMPQIYSNRTRPSNVRHVHAVQYALNTLGFNHDGVVLLIDSDMFLLRPLNVSNYMKDHDIIAFMKGSSNGNRSIMYCCPALTFLNVKTMPDKQSFNVNCGWVNECSADSGGFTHYYLKSHPDLRIKNIRTLYSGQIFCSDRFFPNHNRQNTNAPIEQKIKFWNQNGFNAQEIGFLLKNPDTIQFFMEGEHCWFLHYRGGSNYENLPAQYHHNKKTLVNAFLHNIITD